MRKMGRWAERAKQLQREANPITAEDIVTLKPGMRIHYQIPVLERDRHIGWKKHIGRVKLVDTVWQMVWVIPETKEQPLRRVAMFYVTKGTP